MDALSDIQKAGVSAFLAGSVVVYAVTVDFGAAASPGKFFDVAVAGALAGQKVLASPSLDMPAGVPADELEMDPITAYGHCLVNDQVRLYVGPSQRGLLTGQRRINLTLS